VVLFAAPGLPQEKPVSFRYEPWRVGRTLRTAHRVRISLTGSDVRQAVISRMREIEVLAATDGAPSAVRVHYPEALVQSGLRMLESGPELVDGKVYTVRATGDSTQVTDGDAKPVKPLEEEFVRLDVGRPDGIQSLSRFLDGKRLVVGRPVVDLEGFASALEPVLRVAGLSGHEKFRARLESLQPGAKGSIASFSVSFSGITRFLPSNTVHVEGSLEIEVPGGSVHSLFLEGPLEIVVRKAGAYGDRYVRRGVLTCSLKVLPALDTAMAGLKRKHGPPAPPGGSEGIRIVVARRPAVLVHIDGEPVWRPIGRLPLEHVTNAPEDVIRDRSTGLVYLRTASGWFAAATLSEGAWDAALTLPKSFARIPEDHPRAAVRTAGVSPEAARAGPLAVYLGSTPTALVVLDGPLALTAIDGTSLFYATNTAEDLFLDLAERRYYVRARGRWYRAERLEGPWRSVGSRLPADFQKIPAGHPRARVRASIPASDKANRGTEKD
jgi:hypothetical protein